MQTLYKPLPIDAGYIFLGVLVALCVAHGVGNWLKNRHPQSDAVNNLNARIRSWWLIVIMLLCAFWFDRIGTIILFFGVSFAALREFMTLIYRRRGDHDAIVVCFYLLLPIQYYLVMTDWYGMFSVFIPVYAFLILPIITAFSGDTKEIFERTAKIQWGAMVTLYCLSHVPMIMNLQIKGFEDRNLLLLMFFVLVVQMSDVLQFIFGKLFGKKKIMPALSPNKTVVGMVCGIGAATVLAGCLYWLTPFTPFQAALIGLLICTMGFFGGLVMSGIKRSYGVKDWGKMLDGHGGMLDRVDSVCFAAPIFFHIVRYYWG
ncbi:phosphatidate cytidylyltransferase [Alysiella crassa]|uniref:Phosphatidate cytidylyltransferase n=1 Tax=Alysiella crassa TaxID=153491 RepID=A0A376BL75_9NEIS|nr:phosphatidate cytidylyltransferase [Alysiella crassa]SSY70426.1 Phosphatidate cytidylyltransferase [Alysiella crassa]